MCTRKLDSSTIVDGHTRAVSSSRLSTSPARSTSAVRSSSARLPRRTGLLFSISSFWLVISRNGPNARACSESIAK